MPSVIPTLDGGTRDVLQSRERKIMYLLWFYFNNPGEISDHLDTISYRTNVSNHEQDPESLADAVEEDLGRAMRATLDDEPFNLKVNVKDTNPDGTYSLAISITLANLSMTAGVHISEDGTPTINLESM